MRRDWALSSAGMAAFVVAALFSACSSSSTTESEGPPITVDAADDATLDSHVADVYEDLSFDFATDVIWDTGSLENPDSPAPVLACGPDAGDGGDCPLPASHCVDGRWLESYVNGSCVDGTCKWWRIYHDCQAEGGSFCSADRCQFAVGK